MFLFSPHAFGVCGFFFMLAVFDHAAVVVRCKNRRRCSFGVVGSVFGWCPVDLITIKIRVKFHWAKFTFWPIDAQVYGINLLNYSNSLNSAQPLSPFNLSIPPM